MAKENEKSLVNEQKSEGKITCPQCKKADVEKLYLQDGHGYYCYHCKKSLKSMRVIEVKWPLTHAFKQDPTKLTSTLKIMLWIFMGICILSLVSEFAIMKMITSGILTKAAVEAIYTRREVIGGIYSIVYVVTGIIFLKWIYRANVNIRGFGVVGLKFTPGWSIGYYFIPILCFYKPLQAMTEIWQASKKPDNWKNVEAPPLLIWWWALWLISAFLMKASEHLVVDAKTLNELSSTTTISIINHIFGIALTAVAISLISRIFNMQKDFVYCQTELEPKELAKQV